MTSSPVDVSKLEAALEKATPGPWHVLTSRDVFSAIVGGKPGAVAMDLENDADAELVVLMRSAAPAFVALVRTVEALADEWDSRVQPRSFHPAGTHSDGASSAYAYAATRLRAAVGAALNPQETER